MEALTLFQFALCPYCGKVRSALRLKGLTYDTVEVNPMNKRELPELDEGVPRKVPVLQVGERFICDSTAILLELDKLFPQPYPLLPEDAEARARAEMLEAWVDDELTFALPTVIYGTIGEARKAAQVTARTSNFGLWQNFAVRVGGSVIMHQVAKRLLKKRGKSDGHRWMAELTDTLEGKLRFGPFFGGEMPDLGDVAVHGALSVVRDFPVFQDLMARSALQVWYEAADALMGHDLAGASRAA